MANSWDSIGKVYHESNGMSAMNKILDLSHLRDNYRYNYQDGDTQSLNFNNYSIVGMDATKVGAAMQAIDDYLLKIENKIKQINENADMNMALKSDVIQAAIRNYIEKVEEYCVNYCSQLRVFRDKLDSASAAWQASAEALSESINLDTSSIDTGIYKQ